MSMPSVIFSHGQESGPWGSKIRAMSEMAKRRGCAVESIDYRGIVDPTERVAKLIDACGPIDGTIVLVGSSMGGHVATAASEAVGAAGLFVLAPAFYMEGYEALTPRAPDIPIEIVHGWHDDVVPPDNSIRFASQCHATLHMVDGDHRLTNNIDEINYYLERFINRIGKPDTDGEG
jgi:pimeloyl-ACP methyl ester carboxylesterase